MTQAFVAAGAGNAVINGTTVALNTPAGIADKQQMVLVLCHAASKAITLAGWTNQLANHLIGAGTKFVSVWTRSAASEPGSYSPSWTGSMTAMGQIYSWSGGDGSSAFDVIGAQQNTSASTSCQGPSISLTAPELVTLIAVANTSVAPFSTPPSGFAFEASYSDFNLGTTLAVHDKVFGAGGATGTATATGAVSVISSGIMLGLPPNKSGSALFFGSL